MTKPLKRFLKLILAFLKAFYYLLKILVNVDLKEVTSLFEALGNRVSSIKGLFEV